MRRFVGVEACAAGLPEHRRNDAELVAGEVAANVFLAGYAIAGPLAPGGRGLTIARRLADVVEIQTTPTGTLVRMHFNLG